MKREMKQGNRRSLYVSMTPYGKGLQEEVEKTFDLVDQAAEKGLTEQEKKEFARLLELVNHNLVTLMEEKESDKESK